MRSVAFELAVATALLYKPATKGLSKQAWFGAETRSAVVGLAKCPQTDTGKVIPLNKIHTQK